MHVISRKLYTSNTPINSEDSVLIFGCAMAKPEKVDDVTFCTKNFLVPPVVTRQNKSHFWNPEAILIKVCPGKIFEHEYFIYLA